MSQIHQKSGAMRRSGTLSPLPPLPGAARSLHANGAAGSPKRPPTAIQNFAMGPVHAVLEPLLAQMFMDRPADPIRYIVQYFTGENRSGAAKMEQLMRDLAAAEERIRQLEAAANIQMPTTAAGTTPPPVSVAAGGTMSDANQKVICVLGGPASGKSTLCRMMAERGSHHVISVGQLLSEGIKDGTIVGAEKALFEAGKLLPTSFIMKILNKHMAELSATSPEKAFIINGFPRALDQLPEAHTLGNVLGCLLLDAPEGLLCERLAAIEADASKGREHLGGFDVLFELFMEVCMPVVCEFEAEGQLSTVDASQPLDKVYKEFEAAVDKLVTSGRGTIAASPSPQPTPALSPSESSKFVFVLGGPGCGKGTNCAKLKEEFGFTHLSAGDLLRAEKNRPDSEVGALISEYIKEGKIVPAEITIGLLKDAMKQNPGKTFLIDGFPRKLDQAKTFMAEVGKPLFTLFFDVSQEAMTARIMERGKTSGRSDDNAAALVKRFKTYTTDSYPVIEYLDGMGLLKKIDAERSKEDVYAATRALFASSSPNDILAEIAQVARSNPDNIAVNVFDPAYYATLSEEDQVGLLRCLKSGVDNPNSNMGCYACQPSDYDRFKPFFSLALAAYHGVSETAVHKNDWSLQGVPDLPADGQLDLGKLGLPELSMRVRTGRNFKNFPLPGAMSQTDRVNMENFAIKAFETLMQMPEYGGKYVSITPGNAHEISAEEYEALVKAHIMFKDMSADKYLLSAGIASDWPYGRGCYVSTDRSFIIWVGEEDHLRIMCMQKGQILNKVFDRLKKALDVVNSIDGMEFAISPDYGVVTSCPTNLGTAMRASVHISLPNLTADGTDVKAKAIAKPLGLSVRGLGGEHTPIGSDGTVDISPSARFCITEAEIITALYKGLEQLKQAEDAENGSSTASPAADDDFPGKVAKLAAANPDNICLNVFDADYYASLSDEDKTGLRLCMNSGVENVDSGMGCYACQPSDYDKFKPFFSKALAKYHKVAEDAKHVNDWSLEGVEGLPEGGVLDISKLGLPELSMRVRVGRNLKAFPLPGAMTQEDRCKMENFMLKAFEKLFAMPEYGGKYCSFTPGHPNFVEEAEYQALVDAHIAFKDMSADSYLLSAGIAQHWPHGRGVYISDDKGFVIWVGEEDHLRIMCMKKGTVLNEVFDRLKAALDVVSGIDGLEFAASPDYGVVTSCPTNLGTGMRASLHIQLPGLTADGTDTKAKSIAKPLGLSVRGLGGEHTPIGADGTVDISPSARFCIKESEIITALYKGIELLKDAEDFAVASAGKDLDFERVMHPKLAINEYPAAVLAVARAADHASLCAKFCTPEIWEQYKDTVSSGPAKWTLAKAINTGVLYPSSFVGCHAGDAESYDDFKDFFYPVIQAYHKGFDIETTKHVTDMDPSKITNTLSESAKSKIISTRIRCARNLSMFPLNPGGTGETRTAVAEMMAKVYSALEGELEGDFFLHTTMSDEQRQGLIDDHFLFRGKDKMQAASGYHSEWPVGRGIYHNKTKTAVNWVNEGDHLRLISMEQGGDVLSVFTRLSVIAKEIEAGVKQQTGVDEVFMKHPIFGCLTCCPSNIGTGMRGSVHILVPKLIAKIGFEAIDKMARERNCQARGSSGEHSEVVDRIDVSNWRRIGFPEYQLVDDMIACANFLSEEEDKLQ